MKLFHPLSTSPISPMFVVPVGEVAVISAYGFDKYQRGVIQKVKLVDDAVPQGSAACGGELKVPEAKILAVEDVTQCGVWVLNACQNLAVLSVSGVYRIVLDDGYATGVVAVGKPIPVAESTAVGDIYMDVEFVSSNHAQLIPKDLFFGHISNCAGCNG